MLVFMNYEIQLMVYELSLNGQIFFAQGRDMELLKLADILLFE